MVLSQLRHALPVSLRRRLRVLRGLPANALHPDWAVLEVVGHQREPHCVLDVGAHVGWFTMCWKQWCPAAKIHAFEPYGPSFGDLQRNTAPLTDVRAIQAGVAARSGELELNVLGASRVSNSFLQPARDAWSDIRYEIGEVTSERVPVVSLDDYAAQNGIDAVRLMKIDVQGLELDVLRGAGHLLQRTDWIYVESAIRPLYEGAARFDQVFAWLIEQGFHLAAMQAWHRGNDVLIETDMLFRRNGLEPPVDESIVRTYRRVG